VRQRGRARLVGRRASARADHRRTVFFAFDLRRSEVRWPRPAPALRAGALAPIVYNGLFLVQYQLFMRGYRDLSPYPTTVGQT
jgi:hypothetical protein